MTEPTPTTLPDDYVRPKRRSEGRYRNSAWIPALFLTLACIGWLFPWTEESVPSKDCTAVVRSDDRDPTAYDTLTDAGYTESGDTLTPPGCEATP